MNYETILVFGAHPDDEIAMGGTMAKLSEQGVKVVVVIMSNGCEGYARLYMKDTIVETRRQEAEACNRVLGISRRTTLNNPDMALVNDKETLLDCVKIIREVRPDAIFTHGPDDRHRDHLNTHYISVEAAWHAGEPVVAELGESWSTPHLYFYKGVSTTKRPTVVIDITQTADKKIEALGTQTSQHTLFGRTKEDFDNEAQRIRETRPKQTETFWIAERTMLSDFLPKGI